ncbi:MAG: putative lipoprotein YmbA [Bacteroidia bacterium]|jgi:uncharacterized lipoprotein YmbA
MMMRITCLMLAAALLSACSSSPIQPNYYLLRSDGEISSQQLETSSPYVLGAVSIAPYIDQQGLLLETGEGQIRPARNHLWAEPVQEGVRIFLTSELSRASGQPLYTLATHASTMFVDVRIGQLHGASTGDAKLVAYWSLRKDGKVIEAHQFSSTKALEADGYAALAKAQKALLSEFAASIAAALPAAQ